VARLVAEGAQAIKIEPPSGDPLHGLCQRWYDDLHRGMAVERIDLKTTGGRTRMMLLAAGRRRVPGEPAPCGAWRVWDWMHHRSDQPFPLLRHVNIVGDTRESRGARARSDLSSPCRPLACPERSRREARAAADVVRRHGRRRTHARGNQDVLKHPAAAAKSVCMMH
jgi:hypothetical protein